MDAPRKGRLEVARVAVRGLPRWKKCLLLGAVLLFGGGLALQAVSMAGGAGSAKGVTSQERPATPGGAASGSAASVTGENLLPGFPTGSGTPQPGGTPGSSEAGAASDWSPVLMKGGLGLFVGFCVGLAFRSFFRLSAIVLGLVFAAIFALSAGGYLEVQWGKAETDFDSLVETLKGEIQGVQRFLQGNVPAAGLTIAGFVTGFRRR